ncbi:hypothetical protein ACLB2K_045128 [Fragaria x ananassa]
MAGLAPKTKVLRDGRWTEQEASILVPGDIISGEIEAVIIATGVHSFFGKAAHLVDSTNNGGHFQKVLTTIRNGGIPIAMPTVLSVTMAIGSHRLSQQGAITKRMTDIEEMAGMDVLCSDKTGTLTLNKLIVDRYLTKVFPKGVEEEHEVGAGVREIDFLPFNHVDKRTAFTYIDCDGN